MVPRRFLKAVPVVALKNAGLSKLGFLILRVCPLGDLSSGCKQDGEQEMLLRNVFDDLVKGLLNKKISKVMFHLNLGEDIGNIQVESLDDSLKIFLMFINEICDEDVSLCKLLEFTNELKTLDANAYLIFENKITFEPHVAYQGLKFLKKISSNELHDISPIVFNNVWHLLSKYYPLHEAVSEGNDEMTSWLLTNNVDVTLKDFSGNTALHRAVEKNNISLVKLICDSNIPINEKNNSGYTALHLAVTKSSVEIVKFIMDKDAELNSVAFNGDTPLYSAVSLNNIEIINLLLPKSDPYILNNSGLTSVHNAIQAGHWKILEKFIQNRCDMTVVSSTLDTPLHLAVKHVNNTGLSMLLKENIFCEEKNTDGLTPMHIAAQMGHINNIEMMVKHKFNINIQSENGNTPLHYAAQNGHEECFKILIKLGADKFAFNFLGESVMDEMCKNNSSPMINLIFEVYNMSQMELLIHSSSRGNLLTFKTLFKSVQEKNDSTEGSLKRDVSGMVKSHFGTTPLHVAAQYGHIQILEELLQAGECVNVKSHAGTIPLHKAVVSQNVQCVEFLLKNNADVNNKSYSGLTALHCAVEGSSTKIIELLVEKGADLNARCSGGWTPLHKATIAGNNDILKLILNYKQLDLNATDVSGLTPLHLAVMSKRLLPSIKLLLEYKVDFNATSHLGDSPLLLALKRNFDAAANLFIEHGVDLNLSDNLGFTPLHIALLKGQRSIYDLLLLKGADSSKVDIYNRTPLDLSSCCLKSS